MSAPENQSAPALLQTGTEASSITSTGIVPQATPATTIDFAWIKAEAKRRKCRVDDLLAMAAKNDPFYCGTPAEVAKADWFATAWRNAGFSKAHLRKMHYAHLSGKAAQRHDGAPYGNTDSDWEYMGCASLAARYLGTVPFDNIVDKKQPPPHIHTRYAPQEPSFYIDVPELADPLIQTEGFESEAAQPYHLEVWIEKSTMDAELLPICRKYNANLITAEGEFTTAAIEVLFKRIREANKPARIFVIADFDPAGVSIRKSFARRLEYFLRTGGITLDVRVASVALSPDQVEAFDLPRVQIKETETRKDNFERIFGDGGAELDALETLHPGALAGMLDAALSPFYSMEADRDLEQKREALRLAVRERIEEVTERYSVEIKALDAMFDELREIEINDAESYRTKPVPPSPEADEGFNWLLDSRRDYMEQLAYYRNFERGAA